jgi:DNA-binding response OmpR family regulator
MFPSDPLRILVVDDESMFADSLSEIFRLSGFAVFTCYDGASAMAGAAKFRPHIVVSDYSMPRLNGFQACALIKTFLPGCRIIILWSDLLPQKSELNGGWNCLFLEKPMHPSKILSVINEEARLLQSSGHPHGLNLDAA